LDRQVLKDIAATTAVKHCESLADAVDQARKPDHDLLVKAVEQVNKMGIILDMLIGCCVAAKVVEGREVFNELCAQRAKLMQEGRKQ
jgi:hypothetical protein